MHLWASRQEYTKRRCEECDTRGMSVGAGDSGGRRRRRVGRGWGRGGGQERVRTCAWGVSARKTCDVSLPGPAAAGRRSLTPQATAHTCVEGSGARHVSSGRVLHTQACPGSNCTRASSGGRCTYQARSGLSRGCLERSQPAQQARDAHAVIYYSKCDGFTMILIP